ncbi:hypothetical protein HZF08_36590 [Paenibacillus sp. CGMCC 1.16610]|uniref:Uncharacterized protein n=2 Tax=Paenibacillus TaxID=44249 RepID=A0ABU6D6M8_9BACL|nr:MULTISPECIES: hypothetical protein [Paenibacillus]MBA2943795.1 hypothetical protein [Paenibacillus sp. CGMCC 1.16610]MCY9662491.1 hypothetical protein [Paenibacillus anseongense]MEB4793395.1 hypothetical protein [Paenibacillus chondroitinus]MVQ37684.1 hypothetical protein [Paenibacillus anseongense]
MGVIVSVLIIATLAGLIELPQLMRKQQIAEIWVFLSLLIIGSVLCILQFERVKLPNPMEWITYVYQPVSRFVFGILK